MNARTWLSVFGAVALCSCHQFVGPPQVINARGVVNQSGAVTTRTENLTDNFRLAVDSAVNASATPAQISAMIDTGALLVRSNCNDFFREMSTLQRDSHIARDMVAPLLTVLTGIVALRPFSEAQADHYLQIFALGSNAALAGIDIVDRHFLFDAENVIAVRRLTFDALDTHYNAIVALGPLSFERAVMQLIDHQVVCTPASILEMTRKAINAGEVVQRRSESGTASADTEVLADLGTALGTGEALTPAQAGALWWLLRGGADTRAEYGYIHDLLSDLPWNALKADSGNSEGFAATDELTANRQALLVRLDSLTAQTRAGFDATIAELNAGRSAQFALAPSGGASSHIVLDVE